MLVSFSTSMSFNSNTDTRFLGALIEFVFSSSFLRNDLSSFLCRTAARRKAKAQRHTPKHRQEEVCVRLATSAFCLLGQRKRAEKGAEKKTR